MKKQRTVRFSLTLIAAVVLLMLTFSLIRLHGRVDEARIRRDALAEEEASYKSANEQLESDIEKANDEDFIKGIARNELGLVEPGEKVFYDTSK